MSGAPETGEHVSNTTARDVKSADLTSEHNTARLVKDLSKSIMWFRYLKWAGPILSTPSRISFHYAVIATPWHTKTFTSNRHVRFRTFKACYRGRSSEAEYAAEAATSRLWRSDCSHSDRKSVTTSPGILALPLRLHSHTTAVRQERPFNEARSRLSLAAFPVNFVSQNSVRVRGTRNRLHPCRCQKHPCINITARNFGNTRSGVPGKSFTCNLNRYPLACNRRRTINSGLVSRDRIAAMFFERIRGVCTSGIPFWQFPR
jgi:hypothetical protein